MELFLFLLLGEMGFLSWALGCVHGGMGKARENRADDILFLVHMVVGVDFLCLLFLLSSLSLHLPHRTSTGQFGASSPSPFGLFISSKPISLPVDYLRCDIFSFLRFSPFRLPHVYCMFCLLHVILFVFQPAFTLAHPRRTHHICFLCWSQSCISLFDHPLPLPPTFWHPSHTPFLYCILRLPLCVGLGHPSVVQVDRATISRIILQSFVFWL